MALPRVRIDVETTFGDAAPEVVSCYFDRLRPLPLDAHGDFLAALADSNADGAKRSPQAAEYIAAYAALFDAACVECRHNDVPLDKSEIDHRLKMAAINRLMEMWEARVKA